MSAAAAVLASGIGTLSPSRSPGRFAAVPQREERTVRAEDGVGAEDDGSGEPDARSPWANGRRRLMRLGSSSQGSLAGSGAGGPGSGRGGESPVRMLAPARRGPAVSDAGSAGLAEALVSPGRRVLAVDDVAVVEEFDAPSAAEACNVAAQAAATCELSGEGRDKLRSLLHVGPGVAFRRWGLPATLVLLGVFVQNFGLYTSTKRYVAAMDAAASGGGLADLAAAAGSADWPTLGDGDKLVDQTVGRRRRLDEDAAASSGGGLADLALAAGSADWPTLGDETVGRRRHLDQESYDCRIGEEAWTDVWPKERKEWCCSHWEEGGGPWNVQVGDRVYCCLHFGHGCPSTTTKEVTTTQAPVLTSLPSGGAAADTSLDCNAAKWSEAWPGEQTDFCCKSWSSVGELAILTIAKPPLASECCGLLGSACPAIVRAALQSTTPAPAPAAGDKKLPDFMTTKPPVLPPQQPEVELQEPSQFTVVLLALLSFSLPLALLSCAVSFEDLGVWTKCCLCCSILGCLEGLLALLTQPPSGLGGWSLCRARLGDEGLAYFRTAEGENPVLHFFRIFFELVRLEFYAFWYAGGSGHMRFCEDVPLSGRSYLCVLAALGLYELCWHRSERLAAGPKRTSRMATGLALAGVVALLVGLLLSYDSGYVFDITVSLAISTLLFTNSAVSVASQRWVVLTDPSLAGAEGAADLEERSTGTVLVPPCCIPFCCFGGRYLLHCKDDYEDQLQDLARQLLEQTEQAKVLRERAHEAEDQLQESRKDLDHVHKLRQADHEHFTGMCLDERRKRVDVEHQLQSVKVESTRHLEETKRTLESERSARKDAEAKKEEASHRLAQMDDIIEQPRWATPIPRQLGLLSPVGGSSNHEAWV